MPTYSVDFKAVVAKEAKKSGNYVRIASKFGVSSKSVARWAQNIGTGGVVKSLTKRGRPQKLTKLQQSNIRRCLQRNQKSIRDVVSSLQSQGVVVGYSTVQRAAHRGKFPLKYKSVSTKPLLTQRQKSQRLMFAKANIGRTWDSVMFTDSKYWVFKGFHALSKPKVWVKSFEKPTAAVTKHPEQVHAYGGICTKGSIGLFFVTGTTSLKSPYAMTSSSNKGVSGSEYGNVLKNALLPACRKVFGCTSPWVFMQDNAPCHKTKANMDLLKEQDVQVLDWPPNSPDLNPIENAWGVVQTRMQKKKFKTFQDFQQGLQKEWKALGKNTIQALISDMNTRMKLLIDAEGGYIDR